MEVLKKGSVESLIVPLRDRLNNVSNLSTVTNLLFDTKKKSDDTACETGQLVVLDADNPMWAICEIDTTLPAYVAAEEYKLYVKYTVGSEAPILGPLFFRVEDD
jgi:hypothetical protein